MATDSDDLEPDAKAPEEGYSLVLRYFEGDLGPAEMAELNELLRHDLQWRARFVQLCTRISLIRETYEAERHARLAEGIEEFGSASAPLSSSIAGERRLGIARAFGGWRWKTIAVCVCGAALTAVLYWHFSQPHKTTIANLDNVQGDVRVVTARGEAQSFHSGTPIESGDTIRTRGTESSAAVVYGDGTRLTLVGNTDLTCSDFGYKSVVVHQGTLAAFVQPQRRGRSMLLATPVAQVEVVGTQFRLAALRDQTYVSVTKGSLRLTRVVDGRAVDVPSGKSIRAADQSKLEVDDIPKPPSTWDLDFEQGPPEEEFRGRFVTEELPEGSRGAVAATRIESNQFGVNFQIRSPSHWYAGLFAVHEDSHLHFTYKMDRPNWINIFIQARDQDNYLFADLAAARPDEAWSSGKGEWRTVSIPLAEFRQAGFGKGPPPSTKDVVHCVLFSAPDDRGLVIDRMWVTRGGPGVVQSKAVP